MTVEEELQQRTDAILSETWDIRDGQVVPETEDLALGNKAVRLVATVLYADLADSTSLAMYDRRVTAKLYKVFLAVSSRLIRLRGGEIRSFDGDRVMAVFLGESKNSAAAHCALNINWAFLKVIKPKFEQAYQKLRDGTYTLAHGVGIDTSDVLVARGGIRNNNDLVWVGQAPNLAAKLSAFRNSPHHTYITGSVYDRLNEGSKLGGPAANKRNMWEERVWTKGPVSRIFRSSWSWKP